VLGYHGVADRAATANHFAFIFSDPHDFEAQVRLIATRSTPVSLEEIDAALRDGRPLPADAVHVTFDDGYRNNLDAAEILDRHRVPWSLFAVVDAVLDGYRPWYLRLADAVEASTNVMLPDGSVFEISSAAGKRAFSRKAKVAIMAAAHGNQDGVVDELLALPGMEAPQENAWPMLDVAALRELRAAGVEIGNHSARHRNLVRCSAADLHEEISSARARLEAAIEARVRYFAYPDGRHDRRVRVAVARDHELALATWTMRPPLDRFALRRYEPVNVDDLARILAKPEPWYGARWAQWNLAARARERAPGRKAFV